MKYDVYVSTDLDFLELTPEGDTTKVTETAFYFDKNITLKDVINTGWYQIDLHDELFKIEDGVFYDHYGSRAELLGTLSLEDIPTSRNELLAKYPEVML